jgi:hypothetical protein
LCPGAQSVIGCIDINHTLTMEDLADWRYILLKKQGLWLENHRLDERGFMNQEVHVVCCEDVGVRSPRATQLIIYFDNGRIKYCASNL